MVFALGLGVFVGGFDQTFVVPVLSTVLRDFDVPLDEFGTASWVVNGYLLGYVAALPVMGRVAEVYGHLRVFLMALVVFMAGSVAVALAPSLGWMAGARAVTAVGGGALVPVALAVAAKRLPRRERALGLSSVSMADDASSLLGPLWGTLIGVWIGWRGLFWFNIVLGLPVLLVVAWLAWREPREPTGGRVDWTGGLLLTGALAALAFALADVAAEPRPTGQTVALYAASLLLAIAFIGWERRVAEPLVDLGLFRTKAFAATCAIFLLEGGALITALVNVPLMAEVLWGEEGTGPGLVLMRMVLFMVVGGFVGALLVPRLGARVTATLGLLLAAAGLLWMRAWPEVPGEASAWGALAVAGFGFTLSDAPLYLVVADRVGEARRVTAMALLQVAQTLGLLIGMALLASHGLGRFDDRAADVFEGEGALDAAQYRAVVEQTFDETLLVAAAAAGVAAVLAAVFLPALRPAGGEEDAGTVALQWARRRLRIGGRP
jgi:MFS family permease